MLVYVIIEKGVTYDIVEKAGAEMFEAGMTPITCLPTSASKKEAVARCDAVVVLEGPESNPQSFYSFKETGVSVYTYPDLPTRSSTEVQYPEQVEGFIKKIMGMYSVHLRKNEDYSPANIMGAGEVGIVTRLWDKMARLMNLTGFDIKVEASSFRAPKEPKHESIEDNAMDMAVYSIIFQLFREGKWAK